MLTKLIWSWFIRKHIYKTSLRLQVWCTVCFSASSYTCFTNCCKWSSFYRHPI